MYEFEYDKNGYLFKYLETSGDSICMYCFVSGSTVTKYESDGTYKSLFKYYSPIKILHRFESGESWLTAIVDKKEEEIVEKEKTDDNSDLDEFVERKFPDYYQGPTTIKDDIEEINFYTDSYPVLKKQIHLENNCISNYKISLDSHLVDDWKNLINF